MSEGAPTPRWTHDLCVVWAWEHDADFVALLEAACTVRGLRVTLVGPDEWRDLPARLDSGALRPRALLDRIWDWGDEYTAHLPAVERSGTRVINPYPLVRRIWNKPTMHWELIGHGLRAPNLVILPAYNRDPGLGVFDPAQLKILGSEYSVKGAHSGGSGVLKPVTSWEQVLRLRREWPDDETLVQDWLRPRQLGNRRAWWRVFYAFGRTFPCWADDVTHRQAPLSPRDEARYALGALRATTQQLAGLCGLRLFSTEIALSENGIWQCVDYVNEPCDFRLKSHAVNGVPDETVRQICAALAGWLARAAGS